jgi:uncharacterized membrane protein
MANYRALYGCGALLLGAIGLIVGDFALQWQPVPPDIPLRQPLAYVAALVLIAAGACVLPPKTSRTAVLCLGAWFGLWVVLLHAPRVIAHPNDLSMWLGVCEILALAMGGMTAWALDQTDRATRSTLTQFTRTVFGLCLLVFGASHFVYADFSASMIPRWLPGPLFWVYLTGAGHVAAGLSFVSTIATRVASLWVTIMFACFVLLLHLPRVIAAPTNRVEWTMLGIAVSLTGAAWILRSATLADRV